MEIFINNAKTDVDPETEKYIRELETANDSLQEENDSLRNELEQAAKVKADEALAEMKRMLIKELEEMPAERLKERIVDIVSETLTGESKSFKKLKVKNFKNWQSVSKFCAIRFPDAEQANNFYFYIMSLLQRYNVVCLADINDILTSGYPEATYGDGSKPSEQLPDYTWGKYGWIASDMQHVAAHDPLSNYVFFETYEEIETREKV